MLAVLMTSRSNFMRGLRIGAVVLAAAFVVACGQPSPQRSLALAKEHLAKGNRDPAVIELKNVLQQAPNNGEAREASRAWPKVTMPRSASSGSRRRNTRAVVSASPSA